MNREKAIIVNFLNELLDLYEFELWIDTNSNSENIFRLKDKQGANWSGIEQDEFYNLADVVERLSSPHEDYIYKSLEERKDANEIIPKNDWDLTAKRYLESNKVARILSEINAKEYKKIMKQKEKFEIKDLLEILDPEESFYKNICQKYINTMPIELLFEKGDKILHIYIDEDYMDLKKQGKITINNYEEYLDSHSDYEVYEYDYYEEFFEEKVKYELLEDLKKVTLFNEENQWDFYISFEEVKKLGYGFMVKDHYPLLQRYAIPENEKFDFYNYFSLEQLDNFEESLKLFYVLNDIVCDEDMTLTSREGYLFNSDIIRLSEGLINYEDFIEDYTEHSLNYYDLSLQKVIEYFKKNQIKDLMDYGCDADEGLNKLSSLYTEIMYKLNIKYSSIYTEDGASPGKYITTICFGNEYKTNVDTKAWEGIKGVTSNIKSIYEFYENNKNDFKENVIDMEVEI